MSNDSNNKKILLLTPGASTEGKRKPTAFAEHIRGFVGDKVVIEDCAISELFFELSSSKIAIYHPGKSFDLRDFDLVVIRHIGKMINEAQAIVQYCEYFGIRYTDGYLNRLMLDSKIGTQFLLWFNGIRNWPHTFYGNVDEMKRRFAEFGDEVILKDNEGSKGRLNFLVHSAAEVDQIHNDNPGKRFMLQQFIANQGDLRILIFDGKPVLAIERKGDGVSHLNNTSQGGSARIVPVESIQQKVIDMCIKAAEVTKLQVAGVDVMFAADGEPYLLEINNAPQVSSGSFKEEKAQKYSEMLLEMVGRNDREKHNR